MTFAARLKKAIDASGLTQAQVAEKVGTKQQVVSGLLTRNSEGSKYTAQLAHACGVSPEWLATGKGKMNPGVAEASVGYQILSVEAIEVGLAWMKLSAGLQHSVRTMIFFMASSQSVAKWLFVEPPKNDGYRAWEEMIQGKYDAEIKQMKLNLDP